jgi:large subunit ribosomal protein L21
MAGTQIMEAIVKISGKQYRVAKGDRVTVDRLATKIGDKVTFDKVLLLTDGPRATVGVPLVDGAAVTATVVASIRGPKVVVYKYKAKKRYRRTRGARAEQSLLEVLSVTGPGAGTKSTKAAAQPEAPRDKAARAAAKVEASKEKAALAVAEVEAPKDDTVTTTAEAPSPKAKPRVAKAKSDAPKPRATSGTGKAAGGAKAKPAKKSEEAKE